MDSQEATRTLEVIRTLMERTTQYQFLTARAGLAAESEQSHRAGPHNWRLESQRWTQVKREAPGAARGRFPRVPPCATRRSTHAAPGRPDYRPGRTLARRVSEPNHCSLRTAVVLVRLDDRRSRRIRRDRPDHQSDRMRLSARRQIRCRRESGAPRGSAGHPGSGGCLASGQSAPERPGTRRHKNR